MIKDTRIEESKGNYMSSRMEDIKEMDSDAHSSHYEPGKPVPSK